MARASKYDQSKKVVLRKILGAQKAQGVAPSVREFAEQLDIGVATAHSYLSKLADEGLIEWEQGRHRSLRLTQKGILLLSQPVGRSA